MLYEVISLHCGREWIRVNGFMNHTPLSSYKLTYTFFCKQIFFNTSEISIFMLL